ncbi:Metallo-dependent phosphatase-like protein [Lineolata rhizophorae]|uniref:Metallo-dependent phosphatase-like protein n=1 Tax=Lineolata rhizophorae TaxID=578093 RepID=A0A6A6NXP4_9PEZI|nr:Metallo-dependent phosphatase-like protein [Lineolata rhizophorae]
MRRLPPRVSALTQRALRAARSFRLPRRVVRALAFFAVFSLVAYFGFWQRFLQPRLREARLLDASLRDAEGALDSGTGYRYWGWNVRPHFSDMVYVQKLEDKYNPTTAAGATNKRLVVIGDVHGCKSELVKLLDKLSFDSSRDHLVLAGDLVSKGPDSAGVIDFARNVGASCVRGNHDDRVLLAHKSLVAQGHLTPPGDDGAEPPKDRRGDQQAGAPPGADWDMDDPHGPNASLDSDRAHSVARALTAQQLGWLASCPVILDAGNVQGMGKLAVVHAGLVPGVPLERQDPFLCMNMRTIDLETRLPSEDRRGSPWERIWNHYQRKQMPSQRSTVVYGHDAKRGLNIQAYSKGLDSGCVRGGRLTALVLEAGKPGADVTESYVDVPCDNYVKKASGS